MAGVILALPVIAAAGSADEETSGDAEPFEYIEARLLKYLWRQKGRIVSRRELLQAVWNEEGATDTRTVDNFIMRLRKYFEPHPAKPVYFLSVRGAGYRFVPDRAESSRKAT